MVESHRAAPGPSALELLLLRRRAAGSPLLLLPELTRRYGPVVQFRLGARHFCLLAEPGAIEEVCTAQDARFTAGSPIGHERRIPGQGPSTCGGDLSRTLCRGDAPALQHFSLDTWAQQIVGITELRIAGWWNQDRRSVQHEMLDITLRIVAGTLLGAAATGGPSEAARALGEAMEHFVRESRRTFALPCLMPVPAHRRFSRAARRLDATVGELLQRRRLDPSGPGDVAGQLLAARGADGSPLPEQELRDELAALLLAGHEAVANTLTFSWILLSQHPEAERALHRELDAALGGRSPGLGDLSRLPYLEAVVQESLRLYPPAWTAVRRTALPAVVAGHRIPAGCDVLLPAWIVHRDARYFPDPLAFRPERWLGGETKALPPFAYFPFGDGQRPCIGRDFALLEARLVLAIIAARHRVRVITPFPRLEAAVILRPKGAVVAEIAPRSPGFLRPP